MESCGIKIVAVTCDGGSSNRNLWSCLGISGKDPRDIANKVIRNQWN